jgi:hypothetical protein
MLYYRKSLVESVSQQLLSAKGVWYDPSKMANRRYGIVRR